MTSPQSLQTPELELEDYIRILRRRWPWLLAAVVLIAGAATAFTATQSPHYISRAHVSLGDSAAQVAVRGDGYSSYRALREMSNEVNFANSDDVRNVVIDDLGAIPNVQISALENSDTLVFTGLAGTAEDAALVANSWAEAYVRFKRLEAGASISAAVADFEQDLTALQENRRTIRSPLDEIEDQIVTTLDPERRTVLELQASRLRTDLAPQLNLIDARIQAIAQSITNLELDQRLNDSGTARVVQVAAPPLQPANAGLSRNLALGVVVGLILGAAAALLAENLDRSIKNGDDITALGLTLLGEVSYDKELKNNPNLLAARDKGNSAVADEVQRIRTAIEFALMGRQLDSLLITSTKQGEGKTTLASNLAWAMSAVDHRVALVDIDFRRPRIHHLFNAPVSPGLSDALISGVPLTSVALRIDKSAGRNLIVIPTGTKPPNPANFVSSRAFTDVIHSIENESDLVILDTPPVMPVSDALAVARHVDAVIVTVKVGSTTKDDLLTTIDRLTQVGAQIAGVCLVGGKPTTTFGSYNPMTEEHDLASLKAAAQGAYEASPSNRSGRSMQPGMAMPHPNADIPPGNQHQALDLRGHAPSAADSSAPQTHR